MNHYNSFNDLVTNTASPVDPVHKAENLPPRVPDAQQRKEPPTNEPGDNSAFADMLLGTRPDSQAWLDDFKRNPTHEKAQQAKVFWDKIPEHQLTYDQRTRKAAFRQEADKLQ